MTALLAHNTTTCHPHNAAGAHVCVYICARWLTDISVKLQNLAIHVVVAEALSGALQQLNRFLSCPVL
jgi:hypothetical protein